MPLGMLFIMKSLKDEWYIVIKAYKFTDFEILRDFFVLIIHSVSELSLHIESTDSLIAQVSRTTAHTPWNHWIQFPISTPFTAQFIDHGSAIVMKVTADRLCHLPFRSAFIHNLYSKEIA